MPMFNREAPDEFEFPPEIRAAFDQYPRIRAGREFELRFWANLDENKARYGGPIGLGRRIWEIEIEGVAVWRLAATMLSGSGGCALVLAIIIGLSSPAAPVNPVIPPPQNNLPLNALGVFACLKRDWEDDYAIPKSYPKAAPPRPDKGGHISWNGSNAQLV